MILSTRQVYLLRMGRPRIPCNLGGDSESDSSVTTKNDTSNVANSWDQRAVVSDAAVGVTGDGNMIDRSTSAITSMMDSSSTSTITSMMDSSNQSTNFSDNSNKSTNFSDSSVRDSSTNFTDNRIDASTKIDASDRSTTNTFTDNSTKTTSDYGSVSAAMGLAAGATSSVSSVANNSIAGVMGVMKQQSYDSQQGVMAAFELARSSGSTTAKNSSEVLGFASQAIEKTSAAMNDAKDGNQSKMVMMALLVIGAVGVAYALK